MHGVLVILAFVLLVFVATPLASAAYTRALVGIFSPGNRRNTWPAALIVAVAMMIAGALFGRSKYLWPLDLFVDVAALRFVFNLSWAKSFVMAIVGGAVAFVVIFIAFAIFGVSLIAWLQTLDIRIE